MLPELLTKKNVEYIERAKEVAENAMRPGAAEYEPPTSGIDIHTSKFKT